MKEANTTNSHTIRTKPADLEYNGHDKDRIMDTKPRRLQGFLQRGSHQDRLDGLGGHMGRQLTLNRLDVMHRRLLDSYLQGPGPGPGPACQLYQSRSYDSLGMPIPPSQLNTKKLHATAQANFVYGRHMCMYSPVWTSNWPSFSMQGGSWALAILAPAQTCCLILSWGSMAGQSKARGMAEPASERGSIWGKALMSNDATHLAAQQQVYRTIPHKCTCRQLYVESN